MTTVLCTAVSGRNGTVLSRKTILKEDHFDKHITNIQPELVGAPNFRQAFPYKIYGVAQPSTSGYTTVLKYLMRAEKTSLETSKSKSFIADFASGNLHPDSSPAVSTLAWINMREEPFIYLNDSPFVVRDVDNPFQNIKAFTGVDVGRLENIEERLVLDIKEEAAANDGLIIVHLEDEQGNLRPSFISIDSVLTPRKVFEQALRNLKVLDSTGDASYTSNFTTIYKRVPVSSFQYQFANEEFVDQFVSIVRQLPDDASVVVSCGMGMGRTTVGMIICYLMRSLRDHLSPSHKKASFVIPLVKLLQHIPTDSNQNGLLKMIEDEAVLRALEDALAGNYSVIRDLCRSLDNGIVCKDFLDGAVDACGLLLNLRESIIFQRVKHSFHSIKSSTADSQSTAILDGSCINFALRSLERYFLLVAFSSYLLECSDKNSSISFSEWVVEREEITNIFQNIHRGSPLQSFHPVGDLSELTKTMNVNHQICNVSLHDTSSNEDLERVLYVLQERSGSVLSRGMILKYDTYAEVNESYNFRQVDNVVGIAQPDMNTVRFVSNLLGDVSRDASHPKVALKSSEKIWINLREEPIIYLNGFPYVLRDSHSWLRNIKTYSGISSARIESMECRLKADIEDELKLFNGKLLLHTESFDGQLISRWENIKQVATPREIFEDLSGSLKEACPEGVDSSSCFHYYRIPMTAEVAPEKRTLDAILNVVSKHGTAAMYILNCQLGKGRSTTGMILVRQVLDFISGTREAPSLEEGGSTPFYRTVLSLVRSVPNGLEIKNRVDALVDKYCHTVHLVEEITTCRRKSCESNAKPSASHAYLLRGIEYLKKYFYLFSFEAYLDHLQQVSTSFDKNVEISTMKRHSFSDWMNSHLELKKLLLEISQYHPHISCLIPQSSMEPHEIMSFTPPDILQVINGRSGSVLAHRMILKHDHFLGCQKMTLPDRIEGAPNFRAVSIDFANSNMGFVVCGIGMPKEQAVWNLVNKLGSNKPILWTSFREEPVLFIKGEPYVLRFFQEPLANIESTGITRDRVEAIEDRLKAEVLRELKEYNGRILLHEEQVGGSTNLGFSIVYNWIEATSEDIKTCKEIYADAICKYPLLSFRRIPITDEQAPLPSVIDELYQLIVSSKKVGHEEPVNLVFNCQMGRGRTTTGMVIATIIEICRDVENFVGLDVHNQVSQIDLQGESEETRFRKGEYKIILQLISTLEHGKVAKVLADKAIDLCHHMQNLREAIFNDFVVKLPDILRSKGTEVWRENRERGLNYLMRYFYLIVFADYALSKSTQLFSEWLTPRKEIFHLQNNRDEYVIEF